MTLGSIDYEEPASTYLRYRWISLAVEIGSALVWIALVASLPWFFSPRPSTLELLAEIVIIGAVLPALALSILVGCIRVLRRQRYRITADTIQPTFRPLPLAIRRMAYVIRLEEISQVFSRRWELGIPAIFARMASGKIVHISPPYGHAEGRAVLEAALREHPIGPGNPFRVTPVGVGANERVRKASIGLTWMGWLALSLIETYIALSGRLPLVVPILFALSSALIVGLWTITAQSSARR